MSNLVTTLTQPAVILWLIKATLLLVAALAATALLRRASAGTRHLVWLGALAGILVLPALSLWTPVRLGVLPASLTHAAAAPVMTPRRVAPTEAAASARVAAPGARAAAPSMPAPLPVHNEPMFSVSTMLFALWGVVSLALLGWLAVGALSVRRIVRLGQPLEEREWAGPLCEIADRLDLDTVPRLLASSRIEMPFACGIVQPTVVLPATAEQWSDSRRRAVLFHELAHVKRRDLLGHTLGRLACAFYWFHPLVWTAARGLRAESERACDDLVLSCGARASDYADHLLDIVISVRRYGAPATAMPMARRRELEGRVLAILDPAVRRIGPGRLQSAALIASLALLSLSVAAMSPAKRMQSMVVPPIDSAAMATRLPETPNETRESDAAVARGAEHGPARPAPRTAHNDIASTAGLAPAPSPGPTAAPAPEAAISTTGTISRVAVRAAASALSSVVAGADGQQHVDSAKVALLVKVLGSDPDGSVRRMAAWGLSEAADSPVAFEALVDAVLHDDDETVREMAAWALSNSRREAARRALASALRRDSNDEVRETAAWALGNAQAEEQRDALEEALTSDASEAVRESAAWALGYMPRRPASRTLVVALGDRSPEVRETAAWALAETEDDETAPAIADAFLKERNQEVRVAELRALTVMGAENKTVLDAALASKDADLRARAVRLLAGAGAGAWPEPRPRPRPRPMP